MAYGVSKYAPMYGTLRNRTVAGENPDYFDLGLQKWFSTTGGSELVTNGTFDSGTSGWTATSATLAVINKTIQITTTSNYGAVKQAITPLVIGRRYKFSSSVSINSGSQFIVRVKDSTDTNYIYSSTWFTTSSSQYIEFIALETTMYVEITLGKNVAGDIGYVDNISVFEATPTIGTEITPRTYLDCVVYADHNGQVEYVEQLPKTMYVDRIETSGNRKVLYLADLGVTQIQPNKRYVIANPFGNDKAIDCDVRVEIYENGIWFDPFWMLYTNGYTYGTKVSSVKEGIVIQTGNNSLGSSTVFNGSAYSSSGGQAPARVIVTFNGSTQGVK